MSLLVVLGIGLVGGVGAISRLVLDGMIGRLLGRGFPYGTLAVNIVGSLVLGGLVGAVISSDAYRLLGTGLIGSFTTFSTWAYESHRLAEEGQLPLAGLNFAVSVLLGVVTAWAGRHLGAAL